MDRGMAMITPLKRARGLGSAKEGPEHFLKQRVTAAANLVGSIALTVVLWFVGYLMMGSLR